MSSPRGDDMPLPGVDGGPHTLPGLARRVSSLVYDALGQPLEDTGDTIASELRRIVSCDLCIVARFEEGRLLCRGLVSDTAIQVRAGDAVPLRSLGESPPGDTIYELLASGRPEPFGEYLRLAGFRSVRVAPLGNDAATLGAVLFAYGDGRAAARMDWAALAAALQPLTLVLRQSPLTAPETYERHRELQHTQKMEALGSMAGMIAHDFNNLLTTILGYASILKNNERLPDLDRECLDEIEEAAHRAADLTARLLAFARGGLMRMGPLDVRAVVADTLRLAEPSLHNRISIAVKMPEDMVVIDGDEGQLQQAMLNILLNARDAMPDGGDVTITVSREGQEAIIAICDDGPGMDPATRERIFDPFFTTKPMGSGTGLGMSISYGIVRGHGGSIEVDSTVGEGTAFTIRIPALAAAPAAGPELTASPGDRDLVLVVDDDDMVRRTTMATLAHLGYNVVDAPSGRVAIELVRARPDRFAAVLLDLVMPDLTGGQTFEQLRDIRADLPVIICTGYAADAHLSAAVRQQIAGLVYKPFTPERLEEAVGALGVVKARGAKKS